MTEKKPRVTYEDNCKGFNVIMHYQIYFLFKITSLWNHLAKFQSIFNLTDFHYSRLSNKIHVAYFVYPAFLFRSSIMPFLFVYML